VDERQNLDDVQFLEHAVHPGGAVARVVMNYLKD
jgi:hypothetical protein